MAKNKKKDSDVVNVSVKKGVNIDVLETSTISEEAKARKRKYSKTTDTVYIQCVHCGRPLSTNNNNFYLANEGSIFRYPNGYIPVCRTCITDLYVKYLAEFEKDYAKAVYYTCRKLDIKFSLVKLSGAFKRSKGNLTSIFGNYMSIMNSFSESKKVSSFDDSDDIKEASRETIELMLKKMTDNFKFSAEDKRNIKDIKKKIGYDPFEGLGLQENQRSKAYQELISYLNADDDLATNGYKLNIVLQLININMQIRQVDIFISALNNNLDNFTENMGTLSSLNTTKSKLIESSTKILRENKWLQEEDKNKSKLGMLLKKYREYGFTEVEENYFDVLTSKAVKQIMDMSHKSILDSMHFNEDDMKELFATQRELIYKKDMEIADKSEQLREVANELIELKKELDKLKNGDKDG